MAVFFMASISQKIAVAAAFSALSLVTIETKQARAATITYDFTAVITRDVTGGSLLNQKFDGFFSYDDSLLTGIGREHLRGFSGNVRGVRVNFNFLGTTYTEAFQKGDYPLVDIGFVNGRVDSFKYFLLDKNEKAWFLLGGNHNTNVAPGPGVGEVSYTLRKDSNASVSEPSTVVGLSLLGLGFLLKQRLRLA